MRKGILIITTVFILIAGLYTALWFGAAILIKNEVMHAMKNERNLVELSYKEMKLRGFPNRIVLNFIEPEILLAKNEKKLAMTCRFDAITLESNLVGSKYKILLGNYANITPGNNSGVGLLHAATRQEYNARPELNLMFSDSILLNKFLKRDKKTEEMIKRLEYRDKGFQTIATDSKKVLLEGHPSTWIINKTAQGTSDLLSFQIDSGAIYHVSKGDDEKHLDIHVKTDVDAVFSDDAGSKDKQDADKAVKEVKLNIKDLIIGVNDIKLGVSGQILSNKQETMPIGKLNVVIKHYNDLLEFIDLNFVLLNKEKIQKIIDDMADKSGDNQQDLAFVLERKSNEDIQIGKLHIRDIIKSYWEGR